MKTKMDYLGGRHHYDAVAIAGMDSPDYRNFTSWQRKDWSLSFADGYSAPVTRFVSYRTTVATLYRTTPTVRPALLIDARYEKYSQTTSRHLDAVRHAASRLLIPAFSVADMVEPDAKANHELYTQRLVDAVAVVTSTRRRNHTRTNGTFDVTHQLDRYTQFTKAFGLTRCAEFMEHANGYLKYLESPDWLRVIAIHNLSR